MKPRGADTPPIIRVAPLGELRAYTVYEHDLDLIAAGSSGGILLNIGLALLSVFATLLVTLATVTFQAGKLYESFFSTCLVTGISATVLLILAYRNYKSSSRLISEIKNRMPPAPGIQEHPPVAGTD